MPIFSNQMHEYDSSSNKKRDRSASFLQKASDLGRKNNVNQEADAEITGSDSFADHDSEDLDENKSQNDVSRRSASPIPTSFSRLGTQNMDS